MCCPAVLEITWPAWQHPTSDETLLAACIYSGFHVLRADSDAAGVCEMVVEY